MLGVKKKKKHTLLSAFIKPVIIYDMPTVMVVDKGIAGETVLDGELCDLAAASLAK